MFRLVSLLVILAGNAFAVINSVELHLTNDVIAPDGLRRPAVLAQKPLQITPTNPIENSLHTIITGQKGDQFQINVVNKLTDNRMDMPTSIHWHGLFMRGTAWADGAAFVTQCPITPNDEFLYKFQATEAGTFWYHSHLRTQYCDGLRGPLIIRDPKDPQAGKYDYDDDGTVVTLSDWYHTVSTRLRDLPFDGVTPDSTIINGLGRARSDDGSIIGSYAVITVMKGKRYRFRLLNIACDIWFTFSIDKHAFEVIEVDGVNHQVLVDGKPSMVDKIPIFAGQRYSFVLNANDPEGNNNQTQGNYWIRARPSEFKKDTGTNQDTCKYPEGDEDPEQGNPFTYLGHMAILRYVGAETKNPTTCPDKSKYTLKEQDLHPVEPTKLEPVDQHLNFDIKLLDGDIFAVNGFTYESPTLPVLLQMLSGKVKPEDLMPKGSIWKVEPNKVVEITFLINNDDTENPHPMHLHGHNFQVIRSAGSKDNNKEPVIVRDTVSAGNPPPKPSNGGDGNKGDDEDKGDKVTIRFKTDNSGPWILHCHVDWHLDRGLAIVLAEGPEDWKKQSIPVSWDNLCPKYYHKPAVLGGSFLMSFLPSWLQFAFAMQ